MTASKPIFVLVHNERVLADALARACEGNSVDIKLAKSRSELAAVARAHQADLVIVRVRDGDAPASLASLRRAGSRAVVCLCESRDTAERLVKSADERSVVLHASSAVELAQYLDAISDEPQGSLH